MNLLASPLRPRVMAAALLLLWTTVLFWFNATKVRPQREANQCLSNLKQIGMAMAQYQQDYAQTWPPAAQWTNAIQPYLLSSALLQCPARPDLKFGYAMNGRLGALSLQRVTNYDIALVFDSDAGVKNAVDWRASVEPPVRHSYGITILFADGHVYGNHNRSNFTRGILPPKLNRARRK